MPLTDATSWSDGTDDDDDDDCWTEYNSSNNVVMASRVGSV